MEVLYSRAVLPICILEYMEAGQMMMWLKQQSYLMMQALTASQQTILKGKSGKNIYLMPHIMWKQQDITITLDS